MRNSDIIKESNLNNLKNSNKFIREKYQNKILEKYLDDKIKIEDEYLFLNNVEKIQKLITQNDNFQNIIQTSNHRTTKNSSKRFFKIEKESNIILHENNNENSSYTENKNSFNTNSSNNKNNNYDFLDEKKFEENNYFNITGEQKNLKILEDNKQENLDKHKNNFELTKSAKNKHLDNRSNYFLRF